MALEFISIPDYQGPSVYVLGSTMLEGQLKPWCDQLTSVCSSSAQVVYIDINSSDGTKLSEFYEITPESLPAVTIVMDDDSVYKNWAGMNLPSVETVAYELGQLTGSIQA